MAEKKNKTLEKARKEMTYLTGDEEIRRHYNTERVCVFYEREDKSCSKPASVGRLQ